MHIRTWLGILLLAAACSNAEADWTARGPDGGMALAIERSGDSLRVGTTDGVYESVDAGNIWARLGDLPRGTWVRSIATSPADPALILATGTGQLYRSTDGGAHWSGTGEQLYKVIFDPVSPNKVFATDLGYVNLHRSDDAGSTWHVVTLSDGTAMSATDVVADPSQENMFYVSTRTGDVYRSNNGGTSWTLIVHSHWGEPFDLSPDPFDSNILLWADNNLDVGRVQRFQLNDGIQTTPVSSDASASMLADPVINGRFWYVGSTIASYPSHSLFESIDHGANFAQVATIPGSLLGADSLVSGLLYGSDQLGFAISPDAGRTWQSRTRGIPLSQTNSVSIRPDNGAEILAAGNAYGVAISIDGGNSWLPSNNGLTRQRVITLARSPMNPLLVYAGTDDGLFLSADGGRNWNAVAITENPIGSRRFDALAVDSTDPALLTAVIGYTVAWSNDAGSNWRIAAASHGASDLRAIPHANSGTRQVYALNWQSSMDYHLYRAPSHGDTFHPTAGNLLLTAVGVHPTNDDILIAFARDEQRENWNVYRSVDGGDHWELRGSLPFAWLSYEPVVSFDPCNPRTVYALASTSFYVSFDQGGTWIEDPVAIPSSRFSDLDARCSNGKLALAAAADYAGAQVRGSIEVDAIFSSGFEKD